jgi:signal transduction histidine kinase
MKQFILKIQHFGIEEGQNHDDRRSIMLLNEITFLLLLFQMLTYVEAVYYLKYIQIITIFGLQFFTIVPLVLNHFNYTNAAKWYFNVVFTLAMTAFICLHGWELRGDYCYLVFTVTTIIFFRKISHRVFLLLLIICSYFFSIYYTNNYPAILIENVTAWNSLVIFLAMVFSATLVIARFVTDTEAYQNNLTTALDALQQKQAKIEVQNKALEGANKDLERFAYIASHNLKTPIRTIGSFADLIKRDLKKGKQENLPEYLDFIKEGASQMQLLVTDLLEYSQFNQQKVVETSKVDLNKTINSILFQLQLQTLTSKEIKFEVPTLPVIVSNKTFITAIFQNIIENGIKYNEAQTVEITISYEDKGDKHLFSFKDNGIGIEAAYHDRIFEMFERLQTNSKYVGSGVGLGMSKKLAEKLNGRIWLDSELHQGATFYIELPKNY